MNNIPNKPTKKNPPFYYYDGKGWKIETKIKCGDKFIKLNHGWYRTIQDARADFQSQAEKRMAKENPKAIAKRLTWNEFVEEWINFRRTQVKGSSLSLDKSRIASLFTPIFKDLYADEAFKRESAKEVQKKVMAWKANRKNKNKTLSMYLQMLDYAYKHEYLSDIKDHLRCQSEITIIKSTEEEDKASEKVVLTEGEAKALINAIQDPKDKMLTYTLYSTGVRIGEALALYVSDIDAESGLLSVFKTVAKDEYDQYKVYARTKTSLGVRSIPLTAEYVAVFRTYVKLMGLKAGNLLFPPDKESANVLDSSSYRLRLFRYCDKAGIKRISPHCLRHTFATLLSQRCYSDSDRQARAYIMGHSIAVDEETYTAHNRLQTAKKLIG